MRTRNCSAYREQKFSLRGDPSGSRPASCVYAASSVLPVLPTAVRVGRAVVSRHMQAGTQDGPAGGNRTLRLFVIFSSNCWDKQSLDRAAQALRVPGGCGSQASRQLAQDGQVVGPTHRPPLPPQEIFLVDGV